ncbi:MAG: hypothetical protein A4E37_01962 [Methanoregulaceae archaeon PtaB.Bin056]|jgi:uncharacterized membrane protein HdeD (DUF308 family)|nr:MAG: hypothetical protein A4E37_01962 [Methanoregulaceae archaeon PtaB.Bin056]
MTDEVTSAAVKVDDVMHLFPWWIVLLQGIVSLLLGIMFLAYPMGTLFVMVTFLGAYWFVSGIFALVSLATDKTNMGVKVVLALLGIIAGILILAYPYYSTIIVPEIFVIMIAVWGVMMGCVSLFSSFKGGGIGAAVIGVLAIIFGCIILFNPLITVIYLPFVLGIFGIIGGLGAIFFSFQVKSATGA